jgi:hypothetical protein
VPPVVLPWPSPPVPFVVPALVVPVPVAPPNTTPVSGAQPDQSAVTSAKALALRAPRCTFDSRMA